MYASLIAVSPAWLTVAQFYFAMFIVYLLIGAAWGFQCYRNLQDLLPIQVRTRRDAVPTVD